MKNDTNLVGLGIKVGLGIGDMLSVKAARDLGITTKP
jgi:hypothetical protein